MTKKNDISGDITHSARVSIDVTPPINSEKFIFEKSVDWGQFEENGEIMGFRQPVPGTWFKIDLDAYIALVCCPNCKEVSVIAKTVSIGNRIINISKIDKLGKVTPSFQCHQCKFHRSIYLDNYYDKPLYAIAIERTLKNGEIKPEIIYTHATNQKEAMLEIGADLGHVHIVAIGPAIAFKVEKNPSQGSKLILRG